VQKMTREQVSLCGAFGIPWMVVMTKVDVASKVRLSAALEEVQAFVREHDKEAVILEEGDDPTWQEGTVSIVLTSCVTGQGLETVYKLLRTAPTRHDWKTLRRLPTHVTLTQSRTVNDVGLVFYGLVNQGSIRVHETMQYGPGPDGTYIPVKLRSIHVKGNHVREATAGSEVSIAIDGTVPFFRHGVVLTTTCVASWRFKAELFVLRSGLRENAQPIIHCKGIRQCAAVIAVTPSEIDSAVIVADFTFMYRPEFVQEGSRVVVMLCGVTAVGTITACSEMESI